MHLVNEVLKNIQVNLPARELSELLELSACPVTRSELGEWKGIVTDSCTSIVVPQCEYLATGGVFTRR